ncbi:alpha/beta hydrolase family protein [Nocardia aurantia]|uniref:alpha/beta hydrolase family protein n=1 Tax=Nocardia aurantia TaxID=2585199 RepID=UPI001294C691|nr:alpha/beta hydrolase family protein [Nocardia aurantia]
MGIFFRDKAFDFETVRVMWYAPAGGADLGEVLSATRRIRNGDTDSWFREWNRIATVLLDRAGGLRDDLSRGNALLRAANYLRTAEFFLDPADPRRGPTADRARTSFDTGLAALGVELIRTEIPYGEAELELMYFLPRAPAGPGAPLLVVCGGFDSVPDELWFTVARAALERGFAVLVYEGPGQGNLLRRYGIPFEHRWEVPSSAVLDWAAAHIETESTTGVGISYGGRLLARAAAKDPRYDRIVLFDYFPRMLDAFTASIPWPLRSAAATMPPWLARIVSTAGRFDTQTRWALANARWTFGAADLPDLVAKLALDSGDEWAADIAADVLLLVAEREHFYPKSLAYRFAERLTGARSVTLREFTSAEGGELHCQNGALNAAHEQIFDWIRLPRG